MAHEVELGQVKETLLMTLYLRAVDSRKAHPVLGDPYAQRLVEQIDYDFARLRGLRPLAPLIATRARRFDHWTTAFLQEWPDGLVLHLACGLDSRPLRVERPASAMWIDVDYPEVIALRERLYGPVDGVRALGSSVTDAGWWDEVPRDRPTLVVAEGLLMYLPPDEVSRLVNRVAGHFSRGRLVFDGVAPWLRSLAGFHPLLRHTRTSFRWALPAPDRFARAHPPLRLLASLSVLDETGRTCQCTPSRTVLRGLARIPPLRDGWRFVRYGFVAGS
ncbi:class I SAM-dependent methyltransferase [Streptomyces sp. NPDC050418]|uniref:class I SAM-dependent methyltransferase n=1 Tax=Streptomyces sp. NPDC050418 TaxID=3365612 RepID=UPI0037B0E606